MRWFGCNQHQNLAIRKMEERLHCCGSCNSISAEGIKEMGRGEGVGNTRAADNDNSITSCRNYCKSRTGLRLLWIVSVLWLLLGFLPQQAAARAVESAVSDGLGASLGEHWLKLTLIGGIALICGIVLLIGCAGLCDRETAFKDFDNEESFVEAPPPTGPAAEFSMYPPVESTPDPMANSAVYFEPLPDITKLKPKVSNATVLRPKVGVVTARALEREDSDDGLDEAPPPPRDSIQDKLKLQALVTNSRNLLPRSQLQYIKELGTGYFGKVLQGEGQRILPGHKKTKVVIQMLSEESDPRDQLTFLQEAAPYREIEHPNVLKVLGQCVETSPYLVVLELCPFGDLKTYLRSHRVAIDSFNEKGLLLKFASDMAAGLQALHQHNFVHHDFATRNCLLSSDLTVKVGDYGLSEENFKDDYYFDGNGDPVPIRWLAPECLHMCQDGSLAVRPITKEANVWSYGVALWEVVQFGTLPYTDLSNEHVLRLVVKQHIIHLTKPDIPVMHIDRLYQLMQLCWNKQASQRPSLRELRIMLLHLLSRKRNIEDDTFEQKWNQLLPRMPVATASNDKPISTVSTNHGLQTPLTSQPQIQGFESNFVELDASRLAEQQTNSSSVRPSLEEELASVGGKVTTPNNELSLEAELSAAMQSPATPTSVELSLDKELSNTDNSDNSTAQNSISSMGTPNGGTTIIVTDESGGSALDQSMPDIVTTSTIKTPQVTSPDFVTSTPRSGTMANAGTEQSTGGTYTTANEGSISFQLPASSLYNTAISQNSEEDDGSLFGQKKFAAILQTVAAPSFDGDEYDVLSSSFGSSLDRSIDEVFNELNSSQASSGNYQKLPTDDEKAAMNGSAGTGEPGVVMATATVTTPVVGQKSEQTDALLVNMNGEMPTTAEPHKI